MHYQEVLTWNLETSETLACPRPTLNLNDLSEPQMCLCSYAVCNILKPPGKTHAAVLCSKSLMNKHIARGVPPMQGCLGSRQVSSAQPQAGKGERGHSKAGGEELPTITGSSCWMWGSDIPPERCLMWGWRVTDPLVHGAAQERTGESAREKDSQTFWNTGEAPLWDGMRPKKTGRIWSVSGKIDGVEAPSLLKARFRNIYVSLDRDMKPD